MSNQRRAERRRELNKRSESSSTQRRRLLLERLDSRYLLAGPDIPDTLLFGERNIRIQSDATLVSSADLSVDVVVNREGVFQGKLILSRNIEADAVDLFADNIFVGRGTIVEGDATFNRLVNRGTITGELTDELETPVFGEDELPEFRLSDPGERDVIVPRNQSEVLPPGRYDDIRVGVNATLLLRGDGVYHFDSISMARRASLLVDAEEHVDIRVEDRIRGSNLVTLGPVDDSNLSASEIIVYVEGRPGWGNSAHFGVRSDIDATIYVREGGLTIRHESNATGAFFADRISIGRGANLEFDSFFHRPTTNQRPTPEDDEARVLEGTTDDPSFVQGNLLANDSDPDGDELRLTRIGPNSAGTDPLSAVGRYGKIEASPNGGFVYALDNTKEATNSLAEGETATERFVYVVDDGQQQDNSTATATVTITVVGTNDAPTANDDELKVRENAPAEDFTGNVLRNDVEPDINGNDPDDSIRVVRFGGDGSVTPNNEVKGEHGFLVWNSEGDYRYRLTDNVPLGETFTDTFEYQISDRSEATDSAKLTITIAGANQQPTPEDDEARVLEGTTDDPSFVQGNLLANDSDPDGDELRLTRIGPNSAGTDPLSAVGRYGKVEASPNGGFVYALDNTKEATNSLAEGETATERFVYVVDDGQQQDNSTATATVTITVVGTNDAPTANDDELKVRENAPAEDFTGNVLRNDVEPDINGNDPDDSIRVVRFGGDGSVTPNNEVKGEHGFLVWNSEGDYRYRLTDNVPLGETFTDTFEYQISDRSEATDSATLTITIAGANQQPTPEDDEARVEEGTTDDPSFVQGNLLANDSDPDGDELRLTRIGPNSAGTDPLSAIGRYGKIEASPNGGFVYALDNTKEATNSLAEAETATERFVYVVDDGQQQDNSTATATVTITVVGTNDAPTADDDELKVRENAPAEDFTGNVLRNDVEPDINGNDPDDSIRVVRFGGDGSVTPNNEVKGEHGFLVWNSEGDYRYRLTDNVPLGETFTDTFEYQISDRSEATDSATLTITIAGANQQPTPEDDEARVLEGTTDEPTFTQGDLLANDSDPDGDPLRVTRIVGGPTEPGTSPLVAFGRFGKIEADSEGDFVYVLDNSREVTNSLAEGETAIDVFTYVVDDGQQQENSVARAQLTITVVGTNDAPTANDDFARVKDAVGANVAEGNVLNQGDGADSDPDVNGIVPDDRLIVRQFGETGNPETLVEGEFGVLRWSPDGDFRYALDTDHPAIDRLDEGETAIDSFPYVISDGNGGADSAFLTITIEGVNDPPIVRNDLVSLELPDTQISGNVLSNDSDPEGGELRVVRPLEEIRLQFGILTMTENGDFRYRLLANPANLPDREPVREVFQYAVADQDGLISEGTLTIVIVPGTVVPS